MKIKESELILNTDGSVYHLNLKPEHIATTLLFVGDQDRVEKITKYFDTIEFSIQKREFKTQTGTYKGKRLSVISTGIGADNIDIVINELDALVNIDLETRLPKQKFTQLEFIRIGTSGSLQEHIPIDSFVLSSYGLDLNGMLHSYAIKEVSNTLLEEDFITHTQWADDKARPLIIKNDKELEKQFESNIIFKGITATTSGFYGPQGRVLRLPIVDPTLNHKIDTFKSQGHYISNLEMETSAIYGLSKLLGHKALSLNAIIANRVLGNFSQDSDNVIDRLIRYTLNKLVE